MGFFTRISNPLWWKASKLPEDKQICFGLIVAGYGFLRWKVQDIIEDVINLAGNNGGKDKFGHKLSFSRLSANDLSVMVDTFALSSLNSINVGLEDPTNKLKYISTLRLRDMFMSATLIDLNFQTKANNSIDPDNCKYSKNPDEARAQLIVDWMGTLHVGDPKFALILNQSAFPSLWKACEQSMIPGILIGFYRKSNHEIIKLTENECEKVPDHIKPFLMNSSRGWLHQTFAW